MKQKISLISLLLFASIGQGQINMKQTFTDLENRLMNSWKSKDEKAAKNLFHSDFHLVSSLSTGKLIDKIGTLKLINEKPLKSFAVDSLTVSSHSNFAIVTAWISQSAEADGKDWSGSFIATDVWLKAKNGWKILRRHSTWLNKK